MIGMTETTAYLIVFWTIGIVGVIGLPVLFVYIMRNLDYWLSRPPHWTECPGPYTGACPDRTCRYHPINQAKHDNYLRRKGLK